jgi:hypothetical protein
MYRELAKVPIKKIASVHPSNIRKEVNAQLEILEAKRNKNNKLPPLESIIFWKFRLKREIKRITKEYIRMHVHGNHNIYDFYSVERRIPAITLYALNHFYKNGWNVKVSALRSKEYCFGEVELDVIYRSLGTNNSYYLSLSEKQD